MACSPPGASTSAPATRPTRSSSPTGRSGSGIQRAPGRRTSTRAPAWAPSTSTAPTRWWAGPASTPGSAATARSGCTSCSLPPAPTASAATPSHQSRSSCSSAPPGRSTCNRRQHLPRGRAGFRRGPGPALLLGAPLVPRPVPHRPAARRRVAEHRPCSWTGHPPAPLTPLTGRHAVIIRGLARRPGNPDRRGPMAEDELTGLARQRALENARQTRAPILELAGRAEYILGEALAYHLAADDEAAAVLQE